MEEEKEVEEEVQVWRMGKVGVLAFFCLVCVYQDEGRHTGVCRDGLVSWGRWGGANDA